MIYRSNNNVTILKENERAAHVREMFSQISGRYDLINRLIAFGQDWYWRRYVITKAKLPLGGTVLDVGTGTGDIALEALRRDPSLSVVAVDFCLEMMNKGRRKPSGNVILWCKADALKLPFPDATFNAVTSGYLVRNVIDVRRAFEEQIRVVKPGGRLVCLDTSPVPSNVLRPLIMLHLKIVIPLMGYLITRNRTAYRYLSETTQAFIRPDQLESIMRDVGLKSVSYRKFMFGTMAVHMGIRPEEPQG